MKNVTKFAVLFMMFMIMTLGAQSANDSLLIYLKNGQQKVISLTKIKKALFEQVNLVINPKISISKSILPAGETQVITASGYPANKEVRLHIFRANSIIDTFDIVTDIDGKFTKNYATDNDFYAGRYTLSSWVKDNANIYSNQLQFELTKEEPDFEMWVVMPKTGDTITIGQPFQIVWYDKMNLWGQDSINGNNRYYKYLIEYKKPNKDYWIPLDTVSGLASLFTQIMFNTMVTIQDTSDVESIRVIDLTTYKLNQGQKKKEDELQANEKEYYRNVPISNLYSKTFGNNITFLVTREWDLENLKHWTNNNTSLITNNKPHPLGVVADGNSRIVLKLKVINIPQNQSITKVEVILPNTSTTDITGKVESYKADYGSLLNFKLNTSPKFNSENPKNADIIFKESEYQTAGSGEFYFWYQAPLNFGDVTDFFIKNGFRSELFNFKVFLKDDNTGRDITGEMFITLPPLYLVAGVGGNEDGKYWDKFVYDKLPNMSITWNNKNQYFIKSQYFPLIATPKMGKKSGYYSRVIELIEDSKDCGLLKSIFEVYKKGFSCTQVDWVGHSFGGPLGRAFHEYYSTNSNKITYKINQRTYDKGYIHKLITISSPHIGAPGANILVDWVNHINNYGRFEREFYNNTNSIDYLITFLTGDDKLNDGIELKKDFDLNKINAGLELDFDNNNVINASDLSYLRQKWQNKSYIDLKLQKVFLDAQLPQKRNSKSDVVGFGFANYSPLKEKGQLFEQINIPNYLICTKYTFPSVFSNAPNYNFDHLFSNKYIPNLIKKLFQEPVLSNNIWVSNQRNNINKLYSLYGYEDEKNDFLLNHSDVIIGIRSQKADRNYNIIQYDSYNHGDIIENKVVGNHVMELLLSSINTDNSKFANTLEKVDQPEIDDPVFYKTQKAKPENENQTDFNSTLTLYSPAEGDNYLTDSLLNVKFEISDTVGLIGCYIEFQNQYYYADSLKFSNVIKIPILYDKIGENYLKLSVQFNHNNDLITLDTIVMLNVETDDDLLKLSVEPKVYTLKVSETFKPTITAYFEKGITNISDSYQEFVNVVFSNDTIVTFDSTYKEFTAINLGTTTATIKYKDLEEVIYIEVDGILPKPDTNVVLISPSNDSIFNENDVTFVWHPVNNSLTYTFEIAKDTNFYNLIVDGRELLDTFFNINYLDKSTTYFWRVKAVGLGGESDWSEIWSFTIYNNQNIPLKSGWNLVSSYVAPQTPDSLQYVTTDLNPNLVIMKNAAGKIFMPNSINQIGKWDVKLGYQAYLTKADTLQINGLVAVPEQTPVYLNNGWSIIPYLRNSSMSIVTALASIIDAGRLVIVKRADGKIYMPGGVNQIGNQLPGEGYQAYLNAKDTLIYPPNSAGRTSSNNDIQDYEARNIKLDYEFTGNNASLILDIDLADNTELAVMNSDNKIVGAGRVVDGRTAIVIWGDDESTNAIDGSIENQELRIMNYDTENSKYNEVNNLDLTDIISGTKYNKLTYNKDAVLIGKALTQPISLKVNPNPFSNSTEVVYTLADDCEIELTLYNLSGMKVLDIANGKQTKGTHKLTINSENLSSGTYNLILKSCGKSVVEKVVVVR